MFRGLREFVSLKTSVFLLNLIPRLKPYINYKELLSAILPSIGAIPKFEKEFANKFGREMGTMFSHGRTALYSLLKVWELTNIEVICPAYTCVVVPHAIHLSGNIPVFVDSCDILCPERRL